MESSDLTNFMVQEQRVKEENLVVGKNSPRSLENLWMTFSEVGERDIKTRDKALFSFWVFAYSCDTVE